MKCEKARELVNFYIDNEISHEEKEELEAHLNICVECKRYYSQILKIHEMLSDDSGLEPREGFTERVIANLPKKRSLWVRFPKPALVGIFSIIFIIFISFSSFNFIVNKPSGDDVKVQFILNLSQVHAKTVSIVGDFNNWEPNKNFLQDPNGDGIWVGEVNLKPGKYQYVFVIDGKKWMPDPRAAKLTKDGFGGINSIIDVSKRDITK